MDALTACVESRGSGAPSPQYSLSPTSEHASDGPNIMSKQHRLLVTVKNMAEHEISYVLSGLSHGTFHLFCDRATWNILPQGGNCNKDKLDSHLRERPAGPRVSSQLLIFTTAYM